MNKVTAVFMILFVFSVGISIGMGTAMIKSMEQSEEKLKYVQQDSIQDIVMKIVQANQENKNLEDQETREVMAKDEEKISPSAKITIEKYYLKCQHSTVDIYNVPAELVNLTETELKDRYVNWTIKKFSSNDIHIYREINANCSAHFVLKEKDGYVAVYKAISDTLEEFAKSTDIETRYLNESDKDAVESGIYAYGEEEVNNLINILSENMEKTPIQ